MMSVNRDLTTLVFESISGDKRSQAEKMTDSSTVI